MCAQTIEGLKVAGDEGVSFGRREVAAIEVSSSTTGPLGIPHLPRLWIKALLTAFKALPAGWNSGSGFGKVVTDAIGINLDAARAYIHSELPNYLEFEHWVAANLEPHDLATMARRIWTIRGRRKPEKQAAKERAHAGFPTLGFREATMLNDVVDWTYVHRLVVERRTARA